MTLREKVARVLYEQAQHASKLLTETLKEHGVHDETYSYPLPDWDSITDPTLKQIWLLRADKEYLSLFCEEIEGVENNRCKCDMELTIRCSELHDTFEAFRKTLLEQVKKEE